LEVNTESLIGKAKSIKSALTTLFEPSGNTSLEGVDTIHACYGGTSALFNAVNWVEFCLWDGRDAIVVT
jgi:hydroxymethylglutaryl-CoA synthase